MKKKVKRKLNFKKLFIFILIIYLIYCAIIYFIKKPIKNIIISGNNLVKDVLIIEKAKLKNYPPMFNVKNKQIKKRILEIPYIEEVTIKKNLNYQLEINIKESTPIMLSKHLEKIVLSSGKMIPKDDEILGLPILINMVPEDILLSLASKMSSLDSGIISLIGEIEYSPRKNVDGKTIEDDVFTFYMNDGNIVITNPQKCNNLSKYREIYASLNDRKGTLNLDSGNYENFVFLPFKGE